MRRGTPEYEEHHKMVRERALSMLKNALTRFSPEELRWDLRCNLSPEARQAVLDEMKRRNIPVDGPRRRRESVK